MSRTLAEPAPAVRFWELVHADQGQLCAHVRRSRTVTWCSKAVVRLSAARRCPKGRGYEECMLMKSTGEMRLEPVLEQVNYARAGQCCINRKSRSNSQAVIAPLVNRPRRHA